MSWDWPRCGFWSPLLSVHCSSNRSCSLFVCFTRVVLRVPRAVEWKPGCCVIGKSYLQNMPMLRGEDTFTFLLKITLTERISPAPFPPHVERVLCAREAQEVASPLRQPEARPAEDRTRASSLPYSHPFTVPPQVLILPQELLCKQRLQGKAGYRWHISGWGQGRPPSHI